MSVLSEKREIDAETLLHFIPRDQDSTQLATIQSGGSHSYESEREILYKILYELRGNVSDLRRDLNNVVSSWRKVDNSMVQAVSSLLHQQFLIFLLPQANSLSLQHER